MLKLVQEGSGIRVEDANGNEVAMIKVGRGALEIFSDCLAGAGTEAGPFTKSVRFGQSRSRTPKITIRFQKATS